MNLTPEQTIAYDKAAVLCSRSEYCTYEIGEKLKLWGLSPKEAVLVIENLIAEKYIDDERFARAYAKDKFKFNRWGKQKIAYMLRSKNIPAEIIELAFEEIEDENYTDKLRILLADKTKSIKAKDNYDLRNKLMRFALGRGFESAQVYAAFKDLGI